MAITLGETILYNNKKLKMISGPKGSNHGGFFQDNEGNEYYLKYATNDSSTMNRFQNEFLALKLYQLYDVKVPDAELNIFTIDEKEYVGILTKKEDIQIIGRNFGKENFKDEAKKDFLIDAFLANWDVVGLEFDNLCVDKAGNPFRLDPGGALFYRAQGELKGKHFNSDASEFVTLLDDQLNYASSVIFKGVYESPSLAVGLKKLFSVSDEDIQKCIEMNGFTETKKNQELFQLLKERKESLIFQAEKEILYNQIIKPYLTANNSQINPESNDYIPMMFGIEKFIKLLQKNNYAPALNLDQKDLFLIKVAALIHTISKETPIVSENFSWEINKAELYVNLLKNSGFSEEDIKKAIKVFIPTNEKENISDDFSAMVLAYSDSLNWTRSDKDTFETMLLPEEIKNQISKTDMLNIWHREALSYDQLTEGLQQGPRMKGYATEYFEKVLHAFLDPTAIIECQYNTLGELEIRVTNEIGNKTYNLTKILEHRPDFTQLDLSEKEIENYENFIINEAINKPAIKLNGREVVPSLDDYRQKKNVESHDNLRYGEKLAITLYTNGFYTQTNAFLREFGRINVDDKKDLKLFIKELVLAISLSSRGLSKQLPNEVNNDSMQFQKLYRGENVSNHNDEKRLKEKIYAAENKKLIVTAGLTSTTDQLDVANSFNQLNSDKEKILLTIIQPNAKNPLGKFVSELAYLTKEREVLFPPDIQFLYYKHNYESGKSVVPLYAIPVRTIEGIDPFSYSHDEMEIRTILIEAFAELKKNEINQSSSDLFRAIFSAIQIFDSKESKDDKLMKLYEIHNVLQQYKKDNKEVFSKISEKLNEIFNNIMFNHSSFFEQIQPKNQHTLIKLVAKKTFSSSKNLDLDRFEQFINRNIKLNTKASEILIPILSKKINKNESVFRKLIDKSPSNASNLINFALQDTSNFRLVLQALAERGHKNKTGWISLGNESEQTTNKKIIANIISSAVKRLDAQDAKKLMEEIKRAESNKASPYYGLYEKWNILGLVSITGKTKLFRGLMSALEERCKHSKKIIHEEDNEESFKALNTSGMFSNHHIDTLKRAAQKETNINDEDDSDHKGEEPPRHSGAH